MKRLLVIITLTALAILCGTAQAAKPSQVPALKHRIAVLSAQNRSLRVANANLRQTRSGLYIEIGQLQQQRDSLTAQLSITQQQLAQATATVSTLNAQLAAIPTELERAVSNIQDEIAYITAVLPRDGRSAPAGLITSLAITDYVVGHVSAPAYGFRHEFSFQPLPANAEQALQMQAGICGTASFTFGAIARALGLPVRSVQFYFPTGNHIAVETYYDNAWHYFDPTWGAYFTDSAGAALSITDLRANPAAAELHRDSTQLWATFAPASLVDMSVLSAPTTTVEIGKDPL